MIIENFLGSSVSLEKFSKRDAKHFFSDTVFLGKVGLLSVYLDDECDIVYVMDNTKIAMSLYMSAPVRMKNKLVYKIHLCEVDDKYKGFDLAPKVYSFLLKKNPNWILRAGTSQSSGGRSIWNRLCKNPDIIVCAMNPRLYDDWYPCYFNKDDDEVLCAVSLYDEKNPYYLYAVAK